MKDMFSSSGQMLVIGLMLFCTGTQPKMSDMKDALEPYVGGDKKHGGHILGLSADRLKLKVNRIERFDLTLPTNPEFAQCDLCEDLSAKTAAVEGAKK